MIERMMCSVGNIAMTLGVMAAAISAVDGPRWHVLLSGVVFMAGIHIRDLSRTLTKGKR